MRLIKNKSSIFNHDTEEKKPLILKRKRLIRSIKKNKIITNLRKKISKKRINQFKASSENRNLFFSPKFSLLETQLKEKLASVLHLYTKTNKVEEIYENHIDGTPSEYSYRYFYNKFSGKIQTYQLIDTDQGKNFRFAPNLFTKLLGLLSYGFNFIPVPLINEGSGGLSRYALNTQSDQRKIKKTKNKLDHCITEHNFIKLLSILLTKTHEPDFSHQENINLFLEKQFKNFWSLFKKQAKKSPNTADLNTFWSECLFAYFKELKCPLLKENFYNNINTLFKETSMRENSANLFVTDAWQSTTSVNLPNPCTTPIYDNLETNLQQQFLIMYFMQPLLIELYRQALAQQHLNAHGMQDEAKNATNKLPGSLSYSAGFWQARPAVIPNQAFITHSAQIIPAY
jgi:hypothetical protein